MEDSDSEADEEQPVCVGERASGSNDVGSGSTAGMFCMTQVHDRRYDEFAALQALDAKLKHGSAIIKFPWQVGIFAEIFGSKELVPQVQLDCRRPLVNPGRAQVVPAEHPLKKLAPRT